MINKIEELDAKLCTLLSGCYFLPLFCLKIVILLIYIQYLHLILPDQPGQCPGLTPAPPAASLLPPDPGTGQGICIGGNNQFLTFFKSEQVCLSKV